MTNTNAHYGDEQAMLENELTDKQETDDAFEFSALALYRKGDLLHSWIEIVAKTYQVEYDHVVDTLDRLSRAQDGLA